MTAEVLSRKEALLKLENISKRFGKIVVADNLSLKIGPGEALGIVGPNGAGKTTLFSIISGDVVPDKGRIYFSGELINRLSPAKRCRLGIGRTYQIPRPFTAMTVFENVLVAAYEGAGARGQNAYKLSTTILEQTGLFHLANRPGGQLGLLQRKRLEIARALASRPKLLLLDEVASGLTDPEVASLVKVVLGLRSSGISIIWVEHVMRALMGSVERMICLASGNIIADGSPSDVLASPLVREVFLGTEPDVPDSGEVTVAESLAPDESEDRTSQITRMQHNGDYTLQTIELDQPEANQ